jgi:hypothetical protein
LNAADYKGFGTKTAPALAEKISRPFGVLIVGGNAGTLLETTANLYIPSSFMPQKIQTLGHPDYIGIHRNEKLQTRKR